MLPFHSAPARDMKTTNFVASRDDAVEWLRHLTAQALRRLGCWLSHSGEQLVASSTEQTMVLEPDDRAAARSSPGVAGEDCLAAMIADEQRLEDKLQRRRERERSEREFERA